MLTGLPCLDRAGTGSMTCCLPMSALGSQIDSKRSISNSHVAMAHGERIDTVYFPVGSVMSLLARVKGTIGSRLPRSGTRSSWAPRFPGAHRSSIRPTSCRSKSLARLFA